MRQKQKDLVLSSKHSLRVEGRQIPPMKALAQACQNEARRRNA